MDKMMMGLVSNLKKLTKSLHIIWEDIWGLFLNDSIGDKMAKKLISVYIDEKQIERLAKLSAKTRVPRSVYIRDGLEFILDKSEKQLKGKNRK